MTIKTSLLALCAAVLMAFTVGLKTVKIQTSAVCGMCKDRIESTLNALPGVDDARLDLTTKKVRIKYDDAQQSEASLRMAISKIGYAADAIEADTEAVAALPGCCKSAKACGAKGGKKPGCGSGGGAHE